jgi:poly(A) polymerase
VDLSSNAMDTLSRLHAAGFEAYLVGGCVRDLQLGHKPKDFDVVTNATPEQVVGVFRHCRIIGRRFRLAHVFYRGEIIEVSTFRANTQEFGKLDPEDGEVTRVSEGNNVYGTLEEDAWRRDFTVNALYYRLQDASILDYTGGMTDIKNRRLRMIGDPHQRFHEDPVRLLRAIRLAAKLDLKIEMFIIMRIQQCAFGPFRIHQLPLPPQQRRVLSSHSSFLLSAICPFSTWVD